MPGPVLELPATHRLSTGSLTPHWPQPQDQGSIHTFWKLCSGDAFQPFETHCRAGKSLLCRVQDLFEQGHQKVTSPGWHPQQGEAEGHCHLPKLICSSDYPAQEGQQAVKTSPCIHQLLNRLEVHLFASTFLQRSTGMLLPGEGRKARFQGHLPCPEAAAPYIYSGQGSRGGKQCDRDPGD